MRGFTYDGKDYDSLAEACRELGISYQKVRRLCRHYVRAQEDPAVAIRWCLKLEKKSWNEPKTRAYWRDKKLMAKRHERRNTEAFNHFADKITFN